MEDLEQSTDKFSEAEVIIAGDFRFRVAAPDATDADLTLANGTKLYNAPWKTYEARFVQEAPSLQSAGTIQGLKTIGSALTVSDEKYGGEETSVAYQWTRDGSDIPGATQAVYVPQLADIGTKVARRMTLANRAGTVTKSSAGVPVSAYVRAVEFDPLYKTESVVITGGTQVTTSSNVLGGVRADRYFKSGKIYFEVSFPGGNVVDSYAFVGLAPFQAVLTPGAGAVRNDLVTFMRLNGGVAAPSGFGDGVAKVCNRASGDTIRVAVDKDAGRVFFGTSAGWTGDPVAGTGGFPLPAFDRLTVHLNPRSASKANFTLKSLAAEFAHAVPAGFVPYGEAGVCFETSVAPKAADDLVEMVGINTHLNWRSTYWATSVWKQPLYDLGIRYIRTGINAAAVADLQELYKTAGIRALLHVAPESNDGTNHPVYDQKAIDASFAAVKTLGVEKAIAVEGPNEPDQGTPTSGWHTRAKTAQKYVYDTAKADPALGKLIVIPPTIWKRGEVNGALIGSFASMADRSSLHYYTDGSRPTQGNTRETSHVSMDQVIATAKALSGNKPMWVTEYGHHTYDPPVPAAPFTPPPEVAAKFMLRGLMEFFNRGMEKVFLYTLIDDIDTSQDEYGLIAKQSNLDFVKRPAFDAVKRFIALFSERGVKHVPAPLRYTLTGNLSGIHQRLFQKSDGTYLLAIWNEAQSWNRDAMKVETIPERKIRLGLERQAARVLRRVPTLDDSVTPVGAQVYDLELSVPDHVVVYEIVLA